jgi:hypothetical protein
MKMDHSQLDLDAATSDTAAILRRHADRIQHAARILHETVRDPQAFFLTIHILPYQPNDKRTLRITAQRRVDAWKLPLLDDIAESIAAAPPSGHMHLVILSDATQFSAALPFSDTSAPN